MFIFQTHQYRIFPVIGVVSAAQTDPGEAKLAVETQCGSIRDTHLKGNQAGFQLGCLVNDRYQQQFPYPVMAVSLPNGDVDEMNLAGDKPEAGKPNHILPAEDGHLCLGERLMTKQTLHLRYQPGKDPL